jgi:DNA repair protein RadC
LIKEYTPNLSIKQWAEEDRPREKLLLKGRSALSDAEVLAILISTGTKNESALELGKKILNLYKNDLNELGKLSVEELTETKGIGEAKAITILAALELGRRRQLTEIKDKLQFKTSKQVFDYFHPKISHLHYEEFHVLLLNKSLKLINDERISIGGIAGTIVDARIVFNLALRHHATSLILVHNHPSGNHKPSAEDITLTKRLKEAGKFLLIEVADHIIISESGYCSLTDEGLI